MTVRKANAVWNGSLKDGNGRMRLGGGAFEGQYSFASRFEDGKGTNPEELIGAAHAGCFSMAFAHILGEAGFKPESVETTAQVHLKKEGEGFVISQIELVTKVNVANIAEAVFQEHAENAKKNCPVSQALAGTKITLQAELVSM